jgi:hypothetical protein
VSVTGLGNPKLKWIFFGFTDPLPVRFSIHPYQQMKKIMAILQFYA